MFRFALYCSGIISATSYCDWCCFSISLAIIEMRSVGLFIRIEFIHSFIEKHISSTPTVESVMPACGSRGLSKIKRKQSSSEDTIKLHVVWYIKKQAWLWGKELVAPWLGQNIFSCRYGNNFIKPQFSSCVCRAVFCHHWYFVDWFELIYLVDLPIRSTFKEKQLQGKYKLLTCKWMNSCKWILED